MLRPRSRRVLAAAALSGVLAATCGTASAAGVPPRRPPEPGVAPAATATPVTGLALPRPTGPYRVGTVALHLVDAARTNPWATTPPDRELMVSVDYPARDTAGHRRAAQFPAGTAAAFDKLNASELDLPSGRVDWAGTRTWAYQGAPVDRSAAPRGGFPVVLYSPGTGDPRGWDTTLVADLASRGYVVVSIDATYDASGVEFPGGRTVTTVLPQAFQQAQQDGTTTALFEKVLDTRVADARFTLDELTRLDAGHDPDADGKPLPAGLAGALDLGRVGMFGQSAGGSTAAETMYEDPRVRAGINMDGILEYAGEPTPGAPLMPAAAHGIDRPFLLLGSQSGDGESLTSDPSWRSFYDQNTRWVRDATLLGSRHASYTDAEVEVPQLAGPLALPAATVTDDVGTIAPARAIDVEETYVGAFFDRFLRGGHDPLVDGASPAFPEMAFQR